jgi:hypothetical protein
MDMPISTMVGLFAFGLPMVCLCLPIPIHAEASWAAVAIRQYQETGPSNIHLYLYTLDGKQIRQLTGTAGLDDISPLADRTGKSIYFFRQASVPGQKTKEGAYVLNLLTNRLARLSPAQAKLREKQCEPTFSPVLFSWPSDKTFQVDDTEGKGATSCLSPNENDKLICRPNPTYSESNWNMNNGPPTLYFLRTKGSPEILPLASLPDYQVYFSGDVYLELKGNPFVLGPEYKALFMTRHMDSTAGNALWALDLKAKRWIEMSQNAGLLYYIPGQPGVTLLHSSRYEDLGKSGKCVNCGYLEFWDATFHSVRLGPPTSLFHGAVIYYGSGGSLVLPDPQYGS